MTLILGERAFASCPKLKRFGTTDISRPDALNIVLPGGADIQKDAFLLPVARKMVISSPADVKIASSAGFNDLEVINAPITSVDYATVTDAVNQKVTTAKELVINSTSSTADISLEVKAGLGNILFDTLKNFVSLTMNPINIPNFTSAVYAAAAKLQALSISISGSGNLSAIMAAPNLKKLTIISSFNSLNQADLSIFRGKEKLEEVTIYPVIDTIGEFAFAGCTNLKKLQIGAVDGALDIINIERGAFYKCANLQTVTFTDRLTKIGDFAFMDCGISGEVVIPKNVKDHGISYFLRCNNLTKLTYLCNLIEFMDPTSIYTENLGSLTTITNSTVEFEMKGDEILYLNGAFNGDRVSAVTSGGATDSRNLSAESKSKSYLQSMFNERKTVYDFYLNFLYPCTDVIRTLDTTVTESSAYKELIFTPTKNGDSAILEANKKKQESIIEKIVEAQQVLEMFIDATQEDEKLIVNAPQQIPPPDMTELYDSLVDGALLYKLVRLISTNIPSLKSRSEAALATVITTVNNPRVALTSSILNEFESITTSSEFFTFSSSSDTMSLALTIRNSYLTTKTKMLAYVSKYNTLLGSDNIFNKLFKNGNLYSSVSESQKGLLVQLRLYNNSSSSYSYDIFDKLRGFEYGITNMGSQVTSASLDEYKLAKFIQDSQLTVSQKELASNILELAEDLINKYEYLINTINATFLNEPVLQTIKTRISSILPTLSASIDTVLIDFKTKLDSAKAFITRFTNRSNIHIIDRTQVVTPSSDKKDLTVPVSLANSSLKITLNTTSIDDYDGKCSVVTEDNKKYLTYSSNKDVYTDMTEVATLTLTDESKFHITGGYIRFDLTKHFSPTHIQILEDVVAIANNESYNNKDIDFVFTAPKYVRIHSLKYFTNNTITITAPSVVVSYMAMESLDRSTVTINATKKLTLEDRAFDTAENLRLDIKIGASGQIICGKEIFYCGRYVTINTNKELISTTTTPIVLDTISTDIWDKNIEDVLIIVENKIKETNPTFNFSDTYDVKYTSYTTKDSCNPIFAISYRTYTDHREYDIIIPPSDYYWATSVGKFTADEGGALTNDIPFGYDFTFLNGLRYLIYYPDSTVVNLGSKLPGYRWRPKKQYGETFLNYSEDYYGLKNNFAPDSFTYKGIIYQRTKSIANIDTFRKITPVFTRSYEAVKENYFNDVLETFTFIMTIIELIFMLIPLVNIGFAAFRATAMAARIAGYIVNISVKMTLASIRIGSLIGRVFRLNTIRKLSGTVIKIGDGVKELKNATHVITAGKNAISASRIGLKQAKQFKLSSLDEIPQVARQASSITKGAKPLTQTAVRCKAPGRSGAIISQAGNKVQKGTVTVSRAVGQTRSVSSTSSISSKLENAQKAIRLAEKVGDTTQMKNITELVAIAQRARRISKLSQSAAKGAEAAETTAKQTQLAVSARKLLPSAGIRALLSDSDFQTRVNSIMAQYITDTVTNNINTFIAKKTALLSFIDLFEDQPDESIDRALQYMRFGLMNDLSSLKNQRDYINILVRGGNGTTTPTIPAGTYKDLLNFPLKHIAMYSILNNHYTQAVSPIDDNAEVNVPESTPSAISVESNIDTIIQDTVNYLSPPFIATSGHRNRYTPDNTKWLTLPKYLRRGIAGQSGELLKRDSNGYLNSPCLYANPLMYRDEYLWEEITLKLGTLSLQISPLIYADKGYEPVQVEQTSRDKKPDFFGEYKHSSRLFFGTNPVGYTTNTDSISNLVYSGAADTVINYVNYGSEYAAITSLSPYCFSSGLFEDTSTVPFDINSVILPNGITTIPNSAFYRAGIESITLPASLFRIGRSAFTQAGLTSVKFNFTNLTTQYPGGYANIKLVNIGTSIYNKPLIVSNIRDREIVKSYQDSLILNITKAKANVIINSPFSITINNITISDINTVRLVNTSVYIYDEIDIISGARRDRFVLFTPDNPNITGAILEGEIYADAYEVTILAPRSGERAAPRVIEDSIDIDANAFAGNTELTTIELPPTLRNIGDSAFAGCSALTTVELPPLKSIGNNVFADCTALTSVTIPPNVESLGADVFDNCPALTTVTFRGVPPTAIDPGFFTSIGSLSNPITITIPPQYAPAFINAIKSSGINLGSTSTNLTLAVDMSSATSYFPLLVGPTISRVKETLYVYSSAAMESLKVGLAIDPATKYVSWLAGGAAYDGMIMRPLGRKVHVFTDDRRPLLKYVFMNVQLISTSIVPRLTDREPYLTGWVCTWAADGLYPVL